MHTDAFKSLGNANLKVQPDMSEFLSKRVTHLEHVVTKDGVKPYSARTNAIINFSKLSKHLAKLFQKDQYIVFDSF